MFPLFRYVGESYSNAQEAMEETMCSFYNQSSVQNPLSKPVVGQLVAVRGEDGEEVTRAQVIELISPDKVKVMFICLSFCTCVWRNACRMLKRKLSFYFVRFFLGVLFGLWFFCRNQSDEPAGAPSGFLVSAFSGNMCSTRRYEKIDKFIFMVQ